MTYKNIYEYFEGDNLLEYYDPTSSVTTFEEAVMDIHNKLLDYASKGDCIFVRDEIGYIFYRDKLLISFCVKYNQRTKENLAYFGNLIKSKLGQHFNCFLFSRNERAIRFLERIGMIKIESNNLITFLSI